jgi:hypothetical protein
MSVIRGRVIHACIINLRAVIDGECLIGECRLLNLKEEAWFAFLVLSGLESFNILL